MVAGATSSHLRASKRSAGTSCPGDAFIPPRARAFYPRNPREHFHPSPSISPSLPRLSFFLISSTLIVPPCPPSQKRPRKRGPTLAKARRGRDTEGKAPRSTPPTIGLLSCYFLPSRRTTPTSSRRWSWGPCMVRAQEEKVLFSIQHERAFLARRVGCFLFLFPLPPFSPCLSVLICLSLLPSLATTILSLGYHRISHRLFAPCSCFRAIANNKRRYSQNYS